MQPSGAARRRCRRRRRTSQSLDYCSSDDSAVVVDDEVMFRATDSLTHSDRPTQRDEERADSAGRNVHVAETDGDREKGEEGSG